MKVDTKSAFKLKNHLRTYRKRSGFSQEELAFLLGCRSGAQISRYEHFTQEPSFRTSMAYHTIFMAVMRDLFPGMLAEIERDVYSRARTLARRIAAKPNNSYTAQKLGTLQELFKNEENL